MNSWKRGKGTGDKISWSKWGLNPEAKEIESQKNICTTLGQGVKGVGQEESQGDEDFYWKQQTHLEESGLILPSNKGPQKKWSISRSPQALLATSWTVGHRSVQLDFGVGSNSEWESASAS